MQCRSNPEACLHVRTTAHCLGFLLCFSFFQESLSGYFRIPHDRMDLFGLLCSHVYMHTRLGHHTAPAMHTRAFTGHRGQAKARRIRTDGNQVGEHPGVCHHRGVHRSVASRRADDLGDGSFTRGRVPHARPNVWRGTPHSRVYGNRVWLGKCWVQRLNAGSCRPQGLPPIVRAPVAPCLQRNCVQPQIQTLT